jgi:hypothetical protein
VFQRYIASVSISVAKVDQDVTKVDLDVVKVDREIAKGDRDVAHIAMAMHVYFKCFHLDVGKVDLVHIHAYCKSLF